jgi:hypothetical protein
LLGNKAFSPADQFALISAMADKIASGGPGEHEGPMHVPNLLLGPDGEPPDAVIKMDPLKWPAFRDAVHDAHDFIQTQHRVPARVFIGPDPVSPADFLVAMASACLAFHETHHAPPTVALGSHVRILTQDYVVKSSPGVYGGWIIHRENFEAPHVLEIARLQAWTLKPALPS